MKVDCDPVDSPSDRINHWLVDRGWINGEEVLRWKRVRHPEPHRSSLPRHNETAQILVVRLLCVGVSPEATGTDRRVERLRELLRDNVVVVGAWERHRIG